MNFSSSCVRNCCMKALRNALPRVKLTGMIGCPLTSTTLPRYTFCKVSSFSTGVSTCATTISDPPAATVTRLNSHNVKSAADTGRIVRALERHRVRRRIDVEMPIVDVSIYEGGCKAYLRAHPFELQLRRCGEAIGGS